MSDLRTRSSLRRALPVRRPRGRVRRLASLARRPVALRRVIERQRLRFREGNGISLFEQGDLGLAAMLAAIRDARERVHLETYILRDDATGRRFRDELVRRAQAGVDVRVLCDGVGSFGLGDDFFAPLRAAAADAVIFNPVRLFPRRPWRRRDHRKLLIVDGRVAFAGGLNIGDEYAGVMSAEDDTPAWRDTQLRLTGPIVRDLEGVFLESWFRADGPALPWGDLLEGPAAEAGSVRCAVLADGPTFRRRRMRELVLEGLAAARERVALASPYFAPGRRVLDALADAADRGVEVDLLLAGRTDHPSLRRATRALLPRLLACGVRVHEYGPSMMHAKVALFDRAFAVVGSSNLDRQSLEHSYEVNVVIEDAIVCDALARSFQADLPRAHRTDLEALARRSVGERTLDRLAALLLRVL